MCHLSIRMLIDCMLMLIKKLRKLLKEHLICIKVPPVYNTFRVAIMHWFDCIQQ